MSEEIRERRERQRAADIQWLMRDERGRRLLYWILHDEFLGRLQFSSFMGAVKDGVSADRHTAFLEGRRSLAIELHRQVQLVAPDQIKAMLDERWAASLSELPLSKGPSGESE